LQRFFRCAMFIYSLYLCYSLSLYPFTERYAQPYFFSCLIRQMVNTRTDADLSATVQNALQTLLPQIRAEIREEFRTSSGPSNSGGNPHWSLFILGLNALISKSPIHLRRRQLPWTRRIGFLTWRRSLMSWVVRMHSRLDWMCTSLRVMHLLGG
nr:hypothetical protein [Tanacetum cinerariifolium]